LETYFYI
jgi:hypothetical protein